jgi:hypothetical protein
LTKAKVLFNQCLLTTYAETAIIATYPSRGVLLEESSDPVELEGLLGRC